MQTVNRRLLERFEKDKVSPTEFYAVRKVDAELNDPWLKPRKKPRTQVWRAEYDKPKKTLKEFFDEQD